MSLKLRRNRQFQGWLIKENFPQQIKTTNFASLSFYANPKGSAMKGTLPDVLETQVVNLLLQLVVECFDGKTTLFIVD